MKILFTGGGSGGHFYPIIAIAQEINKISTENRLVDTELFFMSGDPYNEGVLFDNKIVFKKNYAGKWRRYFSLMNILDIFKTIWGTLKSVWSVYLLYPDVIFGKGGYASFPGLLAGRILRIPVIIHESDTVPGKVNLWAAKFAQRIALSFPEAAEHFPKMEGKIALTGQPLRKDIMMPLRSNAHDFLGLDKNRKTILILGGSLGAKKVNDVILEALPDLLKKYQVIHQTGKNNYEEVTQTANVIMKASLNSEFYHPYEYLDELKLRSAVGAADLVISRAGSTIFEIAAWEVPSILIPIADSNGNHQLKNAFSYAKTGAAIVMEENNVKGHILSAEIDRILGNQEIADKMKASAKTFVKPDAARKIAEELMKIALSHEE